MQQLRILIVSDTHCLVNHITNQVTQYLKDNNKQVDVALCAGDVADLDTAFNDPSTTYSKEAGDEAIQIVKSTVDALQQITPIVYFIGGNHGLCNLLIITVIEDEKIFFETPSSWKQNIHANIVQIADGLILAGFGGAPPGFNLKDNSYVWHGYPYVSEAAMAEAVQPWSNAVQQATQQQQQVLVMTHCGPTLSNTSIFHRNVPHDAQISGAECFSAMATTDWLQQACPLWIHGHTHPAYGQASICNISIVNPGSLKEGRYAYIVLAKSTSNSKWYIQSSEFISFPLSAPANPV